ncbi:hypothetical protein BU16DRAFT_317176 [Lophium mytilinum]|uniref:Uncharacterized protein n=1 Tax=Lophium mytilinum TaxID=390894 RepID=A0A6A6QZV5_9PEZI|nr:hypothetical protein BU16DRAFT_317176 [Lophium mytilinum]
MSATQYSPFLALPVELRIQIYEELLDKNRPSHLYNYSAITSTNRQIRNESIELLLKQPRHFSSLPRLAECIAKAPPNLVHLVKDISIHLHNDSLSGFAGCLETYFSNPIKMQPNTAEWWEYQYATQVRAAPPCSYRALPSEHKLLYASVSQGLRLFTTRRNGPPKKGSIAETWSTLKTLRNLRILRINHGPSYPGSFTLRWDLELTLLHSMIAAACPGLQDLTYPSRPLPMDFLTSFPELRALQFEGFSSTPAAAALPILQGHKHLDSLALYGFPSLYGSHHSNRSGPDDGSSITPDVVKAMNPLRSFEIAHMSSDGNSPYLTSEMVVAMRAHCSTLRRLKVHSGVALETEVLMDLLIFIKASRLTELYLAIYLPEDMEDIDIEAHLPSTIKIWECHLRTSTMYIPKGSSNPAINGMTWK